MSLPRAVVALGGNALLRRGEPLEAASQAHAARDAARLLGQASLTHQLVITHGNGPQVGLLALMSDACTLRQRSPSGLTVQPCCSAAARASASVKTGPMNLDGEAKAGSLGRAGTQVVAEGPGIEYAARGAARARAS